MKRLTVALPAPALVCALLVVTGAALTPPAQAQDAQQPSASDPYQGVSNPPPDSTITTPVPQPPAKPAPGKPMNTAPKPATAPDAAPAPGMVAVPDVVTGPESSSEPDTAAAPEAAAPYTSGVPSAASVAPNAADGTDGGIVSVEPQTQVQPEPSLNQRAAAYDPDGDIVHPAPLPPGTLDAGTIIRARLLDGLSTAFSQEGETFRTRVASDVYRGDQVLIPVGTEIDGSITQVSTGHFAGHGSMLLHPDTMILPDGSRYHIYAQLTAAPEANARVGSEGNVTPGSHVKKDEIEYGSGVGVGVVTGAALGGPAGALAGTIVGASAVTVHLLLDHPQATLKAGTVLDFTLTQPLSLVRAPQSGAE